MLRLLVCDSSTSARIARKSSVAETTGKRRTNAPARANMPCRGENWRRPRAPPDARQSQKAGIANSSQLRLSSSSISSYVSGWKPAGTGNLLIVFQNCRIAVNVTSVFPGLLPLLHKLRLDHPFVSGKAQDEYAGSFLLRCHCICIKTHREVKI